MSRPESPRQNRRPYFWEQFTTTVPEGRDLAALRAGIGRGAGEVAAMWPYYTALRPSGEVTARLRAEHAALCLFASHQQSQRTLMHRPGIGLGIAMGVLRADGKFSEEAVDRRFGAAATATSFTELTLHLRGLVTQLRALAKPQPLDYTRLVQDLVDWQDPDKAAVTRRIWGSQYFTRRDDRAGDADQAATADPAPAA
ncbi:type I-E CRISPR-associated protein Cse2/CasB [Micromonospora peucetia]|uniref:CRISPR-associated protein, Cse2 family n=1 Tax=Micromonospora peucetia TaxID=47871 RepID=A0A1C6TV89_9ACTN|nr:type I-E CRISPR-associated protein Cse2/CasB [Micromonospora peucetia]SCL45730.1 CRISPR-associated protein, Cse2 family [Micromonospora peucetia]